MKGPLAVLLAAGLASLLALPVQALQDPRVLAAQSRLGRLLPREAREGALRAAEAVFPEGSPRTLQAALERAFPGREDLAPVALYAGAHLYRKREQVARAFRERVAVLEQSRDLLRDYLREVNYRQRVLPGRTSEGGGSLPPPSPEIPAPEQGRGFLRVLRELPWPTGSMSGAWLRRLEQAAAADLEEVERRLEHTRQGSRAWREATLEWGHYLLDLVAEVEGWSEEALRGWSGAPQAPGRLQEPR